MHNPINLQDYNPASLRRLPLVILNDTGNPNIHDWFDKASSDLLTQLRVHGALLLRGFGIATLPEFRAAVAGIVPGLLDYRGGTSPRTKIDDGVYTSTEYPQQFEIALHNEMSYSAQSPEFVFFSCQIAPTDRGETPVADCRNVLRRLPRHLVDEFDRRGVMYMRNMFGPKAAHNSWARVFETDDRRVVEQHCYENDIEFEWLPNDQLRIREIRPALSVHPKTGEAVWFNQVNLWHYTNSPFASAMKNVVEHTLPMNAFFGDGGTFSQETLETIRSAYASEKVLFSWQVGDLLIIDNKLVAHGRMPFTGARKIVVALGNLPRTAARVAA